MNRSHTPQPQLQNSCAKDVLLQALRQTLPNISAYSDSLLIYSIKNEKLDLAAEMFHCLLDPTGKMSKDELVKEGVKAFKRIIKKLGSRAITCKSLVDNINTLESTQLDEDEEFERAFPGYRAAGLM